MHFAHEKNIANDRKGVKNVCERWMMSPKNPFKFYGVRVTFVCFEPFNNYFDVFNDFQVQAMAPVQLIGN